jgi:hypothetical protein
MSDQAGFPLSFTPTQASGRPPRVAGKAQLAVSAVGMTIVLAALWRGTGAQAATALLLTLATLEILLHRAVALFHAPAASRAALPRKLARQPAQPADAVD